MSSFGQQIDWVTDANNNIVPMCQGILLSGPVFALSNIAGGDIVLGNQASNSVVNISNPSTGFTYLFDLSGLTAANATIVSTSGTAATNFSARIKVNLPGGSAGWINVFSTSNEA